jgi:hypothetical protein
MIGRLLRTISRYGEAGTVGSVPSMEVFSQLEPGGHLGVSMVDFTPPDGPAESQILVLAKRAA